MNGISDESQPQACSVTKNAVVRFVHMYGMAAPTKAQRIHDIVKWFESGRVQFAIAARYPLARPIHESTVAFDD